MTCIDNAQTKAFSCYFHLRLFVQVSKVLVISDEQIQRTDRDEQKTDVTRKGEGYERNERKITIKKNKQFKSNYFTLGISAKKDHFCKTIARE